MILHLEHIFLTEGLTFMSNSKSIAYRQNPPLGLAVKTKLHLLQQNLQKSKY
jgi:hypothetical protein